ncbi:crocetin glucosyltransferase, chloroplastic [Impatiens glandulifera]|uniref:crocetin glucosyltransferase, chloroplastic n=1 Tax=Impatiens glandulifera TaxID=253017 RepID=UPI001FB060D4|nr:crocetin glucosyltransferase, chloroplastic [Impatiens glandulifera]
MEKNHHFLLLCYPAQGHINPIFQFAKQLARGGACVTLATTVHGLTRIRSFPTHHRLFFASFSDGYDEGRPPGVGSRTLSDLINSLSEKGTPVTMLIYSLILPWVASVARDFNLPTAFFCAQSATSLAIFQKYFKIDYTPEISIKLPGLPLFTGDDIPSFLLPTSMFHSMKPIFKEHIQVLEQDPNSIVLINTFTALEKESIQGIDHIRMIPIGPLIPSAFSDETDPSDRFYGIDLFEGSNDYYLQWLDSKPCKSVIYISFGSLASLKKRQVEELLNGLIDCNRAFLWVTKSVNSDEEIKTMVEEGMRNAGADGLVVPWCSQVEVLSHKAVGCFLTHCGWNSTMESMTAGVPLVALPQFSDQVTNAKMVEEVWGVGVKAKAKTKAKAEEETAEAEMVVGREEIKRCLEIVMENGEKREEIRNNVARWRDLALEAVKEGGSSHQNFKQFLQITN